MGEKLEFDAYHGTSEENAQSIIKGNFRRPVRLGWLGCGIYFFDSDKEMALQYATSVFSCPVKVIKCKLVVDSDKIFDITNPLSKHAKQFHKTKYDLEEAIGAAKLHAIIRRRQDFESSILEKICTDGHYIMVRACTYTNNSIERKARLRLPAFKFSNGIELCLKDINCVKSKIMI